MRETQPAISTRMLYLLLAVFIAVSMAYFVANISGFIDNYFDLHHRANAPLTFDVNTLKVKTVRPEAAKAGLRVGDTLLESNGRPYAGMADWLTLIRSEVQPGDKLRLKVRQPDGQIKHLEISLSSNRRKNSPKFREWGVLLLLYGVPPMVCLLIGYWVVAARPRDPNAWLILLILTFPETLFTMSQHWWPGFKDFWSMEWWQVQQLSSPAAMLLFGFYFPERWRLDRKWPWLKFLLIAPIVIAAFLSTWILVGQEFHPAWAYAYATANLWMGRIVSGFAIICIALYCSALADKSRTASTADARRRLRVLTAGSVIGLGSLLVFFILVPLLPGHRPNRWLFGTGTLLFLIFPFSLAYVVVVQRAMDVRLLLRMGTKYALARATIAVLRAALLIVLVVFVIHAVRSPSLSASESIKIAVLAGLLLILRSRLTRNLSAWLDRKFFREAYDAEQLLAELSQRVRTYNESAPMLEMVSKSLADTLHIEKMAILLRSENSFHLQLAVGLEIDFELQLTLQSAIVRHLMRINAPVTLYRRRPDGWLLLASESERDLLEKLGAELLLPLSGRGQLVGLIALGPKRSEEPYTPSDLRLLQSVATQVGLALEIGTLARSLAEEATRRERIDREIEVAREVQERLFPQELPTVPGVSLAGHCRPAQGVGGDYYDLFKLPDGRLGIAIGDVCGKGISAALLMASLRASLRAMALDAPQDLTVMISRVNRLVYESSASNRYATFFFATYDVTTRELVYVNAGHNAPFLVRRIGQEIQITRLEAGGPVIGLLSFASYEEQRLVLQPLDLLLAFTDGISEAMTQQEEEWGEARMLSAAQARLNCTAQQVLDHLFAEADKFTGNAPQHDDMTMVVMKLESI